MLMSRPRTAATHIEISNVHNYYEKLVTEVIINSHERAATDADFLADVSCVALNHLPPRYIRHDVDMVFFMSPAEREETEQKVQDAVNNAIDFVLQHEQEKQASDSEDTPDMAINEPEIQPDTEH